MSKLIKFAKILVVFALYAAAVYFFVPSDVTQGLWLKKQMVFYTIAALFAVLFILRLITVWFIVDYKKKERAKLATLFLLPTYALVALFITIIANGALDKGTKTIEWHTNLVYAKDMKAVCIIAGITDEQLKAGVQQADLMLVPGTLCKEIGEVSASSKHPYTINLSAGYIGIPYIVGITTLPGQE